MVALIERPVDCDAVRRLLRRFPVTAILGERQSGKTTLAKGLPAEHRFDLENPRDLARLEQPQLALEGLRGTVVIDEIQRQPELFPLLRFLVDARPARRFLILGSASRDLIRQGSESLAGRIAFFYLHGLRLRDVGGPAVKRLWLRGGLPPSFTARSDEASFQWREQYVATFATLRRFWTMLSHYHGQILNFSELGRSFGISDMTVRKYVDILAGTFMVRILPPWHPNTTKRLVKSPKLYLRDPGLAHYLWGVQTERQLLGHNKLGASWEGFALEQTVRHLGLAAEEVHFWGTHAGAELDLFWQRRGRSWGVEFKYADAPRLTRSMQAACADLDLAHLWVVYPGDTVIRLDRRVTAVPLARLTELKGW
jgi:predicted AAA+ superfamily ATPase